jgi:hypothetical protein
MPIARRRARVRNAKNLLRRLVRRGEVASKGIGRGTYYTIRTKNMDIASSR